MAGSIFDEIKAKINLPEIIEEDEPLVGRGDTFRGKDHDSLVVTRKRGSGEWYYVWNSTGDAGDVFNWLKSARGMDTKSALEYAAKKANVSLPDWTERDTKQWVTAKANEDVMTVAARVFSKWLWKNEDSLDYARSRGWTDETIKAARLGFTGSASADEVKEMRAEFSMHGIDPASAAAVAILGFRGDVDGWARAQGMTHAISNDDVLKGYLPGFMGRTRLVYPHLQYGSVAYLSTRNLQRSDDGVMVGFNTPKSFNPRKDFLGERVPYFGHNYRAGEAHVAIVEGQADVISLTQLGVNVVGTVGTHLDEDFASLLCDRHETRYFAADNDKAGQKAVVGRDGDYPIADLLGPLAQIVNWAEGDDDPVKDANDLLMYWINTEVGVDEQRELIFAKLNAGEAVAILAARAAAAAEQSSIKSEIEKAAIRKRAYDIVAKMDRRMVDGMLQQFIKAFNVNVQTFNRNMKSARGERDDGATDDGRPNKTVETFGGWYPIDEEGKEGWLVDYLWDKQKKRAMFAYRDPNGKIGKAQYLDIEGVRYYPRVDDNVRIGLVQFPSDLGPEKSTKELVAWNELFMRRSFLLDNPLNYKIAAYYAQFTWLHDSFDELAYLKAEGDANSGKSAIMIRIGHLCYRMVRTSGVGTAASLKYMQHLYRGTVFMDEMPDNLDEFDERVTMLNIGSMKDQAWITNAMPTKMPDGTVVPQVQAYNVFGPKLVTMYGKFPQKATESRFLVFKTFEKEPAELKKRDIPRRLNDKWHAQALQKRNMDITWRLKHWQPRIQPPDHLEDMQVSTRINQVTVPIKYLVKDDATALKDVELVVRSLYEDQRQELMTGKEARVLEAILLLLDDPALEATGFLVSKETERWGAAKLVRYPDLTKIVNWLIDRMNTGVDIPINTMMNGDDDQSYNRKKRKGVTPLTVGKICRGDFRLPRHRLGAGFLAVLDSSSDPEATKERIEMLKLKFGIKSFFVSEMLNDEPDMGHSEAQGDLL